MDHELPPYTTMGHTIRFDGFRALCGLISFFLIAPMIVPLIISAAGTGFFYSRIGLQGTY